MICEKCHFNNPPGKHFCSQCGHGIHTERVTSVSKKQNLCPECDYKNPLKNKYCQNCGKLLSENESAQEKYSVHEQIRQSLNQPQFAPRKSNNVPLGLAIVIIVGVAVIVSVAGVAFLEYSNRESDSDATSASAESNFASDYTDGSIVDLEIKDLSSEWISDYEAITNIRGTVKNSGEQAAGNVRVRVDFSYDEEGNDVFDTRYFTVSSVPPLGAYTFSEDFSLNYEGVHWYYLQILYADFD